MLAAAISSSPSIFIRLLTLSWFNATNPCSFFSTVSGSLSRTSKLIMMSKFSLGFPLFITWGSGIPVTWKKTSSGPNRWKHLYAIRITSDTWLRYLSTMNCCLDWDIGSLGSSPIILSAWVINVRSISSEPWLYAGVGAKSKSPLRRYGIILPGPQSLGAWPTGCKMGGRVARLLRSIRESRSTFTWFWIPRRILGTVDTS